MFIWPEFKTTLGIMLEKEKKQKLKDRTCETRQSKEKCCMSALEMSAMLKSKEKSKRFEEEKSNLS